MSSLRMVVASLFVLEFLLLLVNGLPITHPTEPAALIEIGTEAGAMVGGGDFTPPRTRLCVMYNYDLKHDDDWGFREHFPQTVGQLADGTTYGQDLADCPYGKTCPKRYAPCTLVNLEGDRVNTRGEVTSKFKLTDTYPSVPCLGSMKKGMFGGVKNILGHACTPPVGADSIWTDSKQWTWYNSPDQIPLKSGVKVGAAAPGSDSGEACPMPTYTLIEVADRSESSFPQMSAARKAECEKERQAWLKSRAAKGDAKAKLALKTLKATPTLASKAKTPSVAKVAGRKSVPLTKSVPKPVSKAKKPTAAKKAKF